MHVIKICLVAIFAVITCTGCFAKPLNSNKHQAGVSSSKKRLQFSADTTEFTVSSLFQSNMVLQRGKPVKIWGKASPALSIFIKTSWSNKTFDVVTGADSTWMLSLPATSANASPQTISISAKGKQTIKLNNILIGDVWVCSGQSNMVMPMPWANVFLQGTVNYKEEIAKASHPNLRYMAMQMNRQDKPLSDYKDTSKWSVCTPEAAEHYNGIGYSAIGYYFGQKLDSALQIPIGILVSAVGATGCQEWTGMDTIEANPVLSYYKPFNPANLYNGMIYPLRNLSIKGFIWDQGESNEYDSPVSNYTVLNSAMIKQWRTLFNQGDLPFYFVQMTPTEFDKGTDDFYAFFREAQANVRKVKNTGMAVTIDDPEIKNIHFTHKEPAADRLARLAMRYAYNLNVIANGPSYKSFSQKDSTVTIYFSHAAGLKTTEPLSQLFFVAGNDHKFYNATATIQDDNIILKVPLPVNTVKAIRYAFTNTSIGSLYNTGNLPMEPFRTDNLAQ